MKKLFYYYFTEKIIKNIIICYLYFRGVKKGKVLIWLNSSYNNSGKDTVVKYCKIRSFDIGWVTNTRMYFTVNLDLSYEINKPYSTAFINIKEIISLNSAFFWLKKWYSDLPNNLIK